MKTNKFWLVVALGAALAVCGLTSCEKDNYELPEVIESEVSDSGIDETVTETRLMKKAASASVTKPGFRFRDRPARASTTGLRQR